MYYLKHSLILLFALIGSWGSATIVEAYGRTITNPATNSSLSSSVIRNELQILEDEITYNVISTSTAAVLGNLLYFSGAASVANVATTSVTCAGSASCSTFTVIGSSPITITGTATFPFTPTSYGNATSSTIGFTNGLLSTSSSTFSYLTSGLVGNNNGRLYSFASSTLSIGGNALTATTLQTARTINGVSFDGSANITVASTTLLADVNTWTNTQGMNISGNAATVTTNANLSGAVTSSGSNVTAFGVLAANSVLANGTSASAIPTAIATSTLYGVGTYGQYLGMSGGVLGLRATTTLFSGTTGQFPYFSGTNTLTATSSLFITTGGQVSTIAIQPATSTAMVLDWQSSPNQVEYQIGSSATTITFVNATVTAMWGSTKRVWVCNPNGTAGALTWAGVEWIGSAPTQTTTANQCDIYSFNITRATSTSAYKVGGTAGTGFK